MISWRTRVMTARAVLAAVLWLLLAATAGQAFADGGPVGSDLHVAQTLGDRELTVVIRRVDTAPAPVHIDVITHAGSPGGELRLRLAAPGERPVSSAALPLTDVPGPRSVVLRVDRFGPWNLELDDGDGHTAGIAFTVPERITPWWERLAYGGFVAAGAFLLVAIAMRRRPWLPAIGMIVALTVALTSALLSPTIGPVPLAEPSRPPVNMTVSTGAAAVAGAPVDLALRLSDGSTGRPVDDLVVTHAALAHLAVISPTGRLYHLHPVDTGGGMYRVRWRPVDSGRHLLTMEVNRRGGGGQELRGAVEVAPGLSAPAPEVPIGPGPREFEGVRSEVSVTGLVAGRPSTMTVDFGGPSTMQPWLGMRGHLMLLGPLPAENVWAHVHAMTPPTPGALGGQPDETVAAYSPRIDFTFTFPEPGRYRLWFQAERDYRIITAPAIVDVAS